MDGRILVIDHPNQGQLESFFLGRLVSYLYHQEKFQPDVKSYLKLSGVDPHKYDVVISVSGFCKIRGNSDLDAENELTDICEKDSIPLLCLDHGAQIRAVHLFGDDAIEKTVEKDRLSRIKIYNDYVPIGYNNIVDPLFNNIKIEDLKAKEYHEWDIVKLDSPYTSILVDPNYNVIIARNKDRNKIDYLMQMEPAYVPKPGEKVNAILLLHNFLNMVRRKKACS